MPSRLTVVLVSLLLATPAVIFWFWLVIVPARVAVLCPEECQCDPGGYFVHCSGTSLNPAPLIHLRGVRFLRLFINKIKFFEKDSFVSLSELENLHVLFCELRRIELGAFNGLTNLIELVLRYNKIREISPGTFENMNSLEYLDLVNNRIQHLDSAVFSGLVKLKKIHLQRNKLQYLQPDTFLLLPNLQELFLGENRALQMPADRNFINSHSLSRLDISSLYNVSSVSVETFANIRALERLDLSYNNLRTVDINILKALPNLSELYLYGNPLQCDCQLQEVWRWCKNNHIQTANRGYVPKCETPSEVKEMRWVVLDKGKCLEGKIQYYGDYNRTRYIYNDINERSIFEYDVEFFMRYKVPLYAFPFIFGTISNVILLIVFICNKDMRTVPNLYILNLAISDIIYLTVLFSEAVANRIPDTWLDGDFMCMFLPFCLRLSVGLSAYSVAVYSIQRYRATVNPLVVGFLSPPTWRFTLATICGVWIVAALFAVPSVLSKYMCEGIFILGSIPYYRRVVIFEFLVSCVFPLCVVVFTYIMTARHLVQSPRCISEGTQNPQLNTRRDTAKIVVGLAFVFLISYVPYHVFWTYVICTKDEDIFPEEFTKYLIFSNYQLQYPYLISTVFLLINSCLNPVALFCTSSPFRQHLKRYLTCFCRTNSPLTDFELIRRN